MSDAVPNRAPRAVNSADVARAAGVSQSAVSRVFTQGASVSPEMRERVTDAAEKLGYRPNALARSLISGRSRIIGVLVAYLDNQFYPGVLERLSRLLQARGYRVMLFMSDTGDQDGVVRELLQYQVEGVVMASVHLSSGLARECAGAGIPVVLFNRTVAAAPASFVTSDNLDGGRQVGALLARAGHERIAFIAGDEDSSTNRDREAGFQDGLSSSGAVCAARAVGGYTAQGAADAARALFGGRARKPDAVFVANDHMAFAVLDVLRSELGLQVPAQISVVGYDDVPQAAWKAYDLTTVRQPAQPMIEAVVEILMEQVGGGVTSRSVKVPAQLVERATHRTG